MTREDSEVGEAPKGETALLVCTAVVRYTASVADERPQKSRTARFLKGTQEKEEDL